MEDSAEAEKELLNAAGECQKIMNTQYGTAVYVSISLIHNSYTSIARAFKEANETMEYQFLSGDLEILDYKNISNYSDAFIVKDFENNKKLKNYIEIGDFTGAKEVVKSIFDKSFYDRKSSMSLYSMKAKMYGLVNLIIEAMYDLTARYDYDFFENINPEKRFFNCDNLSKLHKEMNNILDYADNYVKSREVKKNDNLLNRIMEFINLNYSDNNLSVGIISEEFGLTVPYISKFFKKKVGKGLLDYIHSVRIEHAKELLKDENLQIKDVAERSGYYNTVAFIRVFKKFEGVPPGRYVKNIIGV
jgi:YesN/AraC family two-component response regulator